MNLQNRWIGAGSNSSFAVAVDDQQLAIQGGGTGIRHQGLLDGALARPKNLAAYGEPDVAALAASYACGIARTHPVVDGNKRTALIVCETFILDERLFIVSDRRRTGGSFRESWGRQDS